VTLAAGTVVKAGAVDYGNGPVAPGVLSVDGSLVGSGTAGSPVVFTSLLDDSVGGDTNGDRGGSSAQAGDWAGIVVGGSDASLDADHLVVRYAAEAVGVAGGTARLNASAISDSATGIRLTSGTASFRGALRRVTLGLAACSWGAANCSIDGAYTDWGSANGPRPATVGGSALACGQVAVDPWVGQAEVPTSLFVARNCDGSGTPEVKGAASEGAFYGRLGQADVDCSTIPDDCAQADRMRTCLTEGINLAKAGSTFPIPVDGSDWAAEGGSQAADAATSYLRASLDTAVSTAGMVLGAAAKIIGAVALISAINSAYDNCLGA
jgi:hypothetical protein